ncbi:ras guanine nucleotide exchange factor domain-containing protein [Stachybotrys elegans]|uniref:Ras guanine nucleotide exchange factor domain-containing protein n=1 Tax=Stachybotrys elegans TaxID=80388 RepID=A0A8K0SXB0_9HYPO|nr:ras guanine nucleotide exchange factor domain-containing protein [Stachybotrys elegans]
MTPPDTPNGSQEALGSESLVPPVFHNFLRAFYPFHPTYAMADSSVTLPLDEGDVVLIHSIHTNGWADGTRLLTGARGWLPTNYCEPYEPEDMRNLLKALLNFWDLLRSTSVNDSEIFGNQEFMKGIIAGVRFLLERTHCLNRESVTVQRNDSLRRCRKSLLSELSSLVKTGKRLQESQRDGSMSEEELVNEVNNIVDEMILKAFKIVTKGVRFLDVLEEDSKTRVAPPVTIMATVVEESCNPPTPPADRSAFDDQGHESASDAGSRVTIDDAATSVATSESSEAIYGLSMSRNLRHPASSPMSPSFQGGSPQSNRVSISFSHRISLAGPSPLSRPQHLVSERLSRSHDKFLSHLGSFIGRLHLQSQSRPELALAIKQSALSGGELLAVIDAVCGHNNPNPDALKLARSIMAQRIHELVYSARDTMVHAATEEADVIMLQDNSILLLSATGCVRAAGECVAKAKTTIERIGDFEYDSEENALDFDVTVLNPVPQTRTRADSVATKSDAGSTADSVRTTESSTSSRKLTAASVDKPLPEVPEVTNDEEEEEEQSTPSQTPAQPWQEKSSAARASIISTRQSLPPLPRISTNHEQDIHTSRFDSIAGSSAGSSATYMSRDSETSAISQTSTRATTPDHAPRHQQSISDLSSAGSGPHVDDVDEVETRLMEKTFAHELIFNKEGQVTGGSLPALIERLTTHESTPDATFVSTFYLTFRLFCTPIKLTEALIDRFEYVGESPRMAAPVRLRVYNAFKGWMESHWRDDLDRIALQLIIPFAEMRLAAVLPSAGRRLLELAQRVSGEGSLVPRLVSSMGKTNTAVAQTVPLDTPIPQPTISRSQQGLLATWKSGGTMPTILDFDATELARQLTIKQMSIFCSILPEELLASQWMKNGGVDAPNVKAMSSLSTDLSNLVADSILQYSEIKKRATAIKQWIKIAQHCLELNNYDGLMAIICSLNSSTISRLRKTWDVVSVKRKEALRLLQEIVEPSQNHKVLRTRLHDHVPPCLPFLGMYLTDLTFVDIGNPATKQISLGKEAEEDGQSGLTVVNFDKHTRTAKIIGELQRFQIPYRLADVPDMQEWISAQIGRVREGDQGNVQVTYYRKSLLLEPREAAGLRAPMEPTTPISAGGSRTDLFGWMSRGGATTTTTTTQV